MSQLFKNNATSRLVANLPATGAGSLAISVTADTGLLFPAVTLGGTDHFLITLENSAGEKEIVKITSRVIDDFVIDAAGRGMEGTTPRAFNAGDIVELRLTSGFIDALKKGSIVYVIDGGGAVITAGIKGFIEVPFSGSLEEIRLFADPIDPAGAEISIDLLKDNYAGYPPDDTWNRMGNPVVITSGTNKSEDDLSQWPVADRMFVAGDIFAFDVNSCSIITRVTISATVDRN